MESVKIGSVGLGRLGTNMQKKLSRIHSRLRPPRHL